MGDVKMEDVLRLVASNYDGISQELYQTANLLETNAKYNIQSKMLSMVRVAETNTVSLRNIASRAIETDVGAFYEDVAGILGISVRECDKWIEITVPAILPNRNFKENQAFLMRPLRNALIQFQRETPIERFSSCAICIVHQYDEALGRRRVRDYDNVETKRYLDVIESVMLTNDSGLLCTVLQATEMSDRDATKFYLMQPETLPAWAKKHIKSHT